jgi:UPF0176 protein
MIVVAALYKFADLPDFVALRERLLELCTIHAIRGSLLLAKEGINGTVAGSRDAIDALRAFLFADNRFNGIEYKESFAEKNPFPRMKVKLKKEIVTLGRPEANPNEIVGTYVNPHEWNQLLNDPKVVVIDVRNDYEVDLGTFTNAINPKTESFREFPDFVSKNLDPEKHQKIAMMCTGGIRCEKASSYMKKQGFNEVYHLKGGILKYLEETPKSESKWQGECFVFDNRVTVNHDMKPGVYSLCHGCRNPLSPDDMASELYVKGISCPRCNGKRSEKQVASAASRQKQIELAKARGQSHMVAGS